MLSSTQGFDEGKLNSDNHPAPNFRVFDQNGYSLSSITQEQSHPPCVVYSMVSIFNSLFSRYEPFKYMMEQTDQFFWSPTALTPIFYLNSTELQRITQAWMFPHLDQTKSPIKNAEQKWLDKFQKSERALQKERKPFAHKILAWQSALALEDYGKICKFVSALLIPETILASVFPDSQPTLLDEISVNITLLVPYTREVVQTFTDHNTKPSKRREEESDPHRSEEKNIDPSLYLYLAEEFSVFLMLAKLDTLQLIQEAFSCTLSISISDENKIRPILSYPISAAKDGLAEKTLSVFLKVQDIYHEYYKRLELPFIREKLTLVDSVVPREFLFSQKGKNSSRSPSPPDEKQIQTPPSGAEKKIFSSSPPLSSCVSSSFHHPELGEKSAAKIFKQFIEQHEQSGSRSLKISYKNGITCNIVLLNENADCGRKVNKEGVLKMIKDAVDSVLDDDADLLIEVIFSYQSCCYKLTTERTKPECLPVVRIK